jgi:hypothetical protein
MYGPRRGGSLSAHAPLAVRRHLGIRISSALLLQMLLPLPFFFLILYYYMVLIDENPNYV